MATLPPWLTVSPSDFLQAAQAGAAIGQRIGSGINEANIARERIAASERENASRVGAQSAIASQHMAAQQQEAEAARALRDWELRQRLGMDQDRLSLQGDELENRQMMAMKNLELGQSRLGLDAKKEEDLIKKQEQDRLSPIYRTVENQLVKVDPTSGEAESLFTAPYRPASGGGELARIMRDAMATTGTGTNATGLPQPDSQYRVGATYGGLKYLGGDPNNEASWQKVR